MAAAALRLILKRRTSVAKTRVFVSSRRLNALRPAAVIRPEAMSAFARAMFGRLQWLPGCRGAKCTR